MVAGASRMQARKTKRYPATQMRKSVYPLARAKGAGARAAVRSRVKSSASATNWTANRIAVTNTKVHSTAVSGTSWRFSRSNRLGRSSSRRGVQDVGGEQLPGQVGAEDRDDQPDPDERPAPGTHRRLQDTADRGLRQVRDLGAGQDAVGQDRGRGEEGQHRQEAQYRGKADVLAPSGVAGVDAGALDAQEDEHRDQHRALDLLEQRVPTGQVVAAGDRLQVGEQLRQGRHDEDPVEGAAGAGRGPEPDRRQEAGVEPEAGPGIDIDAVVEVRLAHREVLEDEGEHEHAQPGDRPRDQRAVDAGPPSEASR